MGAHICKYMGDKKIQPHIHQMPLCVLFSVTFIHEIVTNNAQL